MFEHTKAELAAKAEKYNFVRDTLEKVLRLADILKYINGNPLTKNRLALKGGTAINLTIFNLTRLSVDIDLDFCGDMSREEMLEQREIISENIRTYMAAQGYTLNPQSRKRHSLDSFVFMYRNLGGVNDNIKVEINYSLRSHIFEPKCTAVVSDVIEDKISVFCLDPIEIFAAKINALLSRGAARDLYDTYNMVKFGLFDDDLDRLRKSVIMYTVISQEVIRQDYDLGIINSISMRKIKTDLLPVIRRGEFIELDSMKKQVVEFLSELLVLSDNEKDFLSEFSEKRFKPQLVFSDENILERLNAHPMIRWKMQNGIK